MVRGDVEGALLALDRESAAQENDIAIDLFKLNLFERMGNLKEAESVLRKLIELHPQEGTFRRYLVKLYIDQKRFDDAEKELRALAAANPTNVEPELDLVRFLRFVKGPAAARQELVTRINAGGEVFPYQMALTEFDLAQGDVTASIQLLEKLADSANSREHALTAKVKLAEIQLSRKNFDAAEPLVADILRKDDRNVGGLKLRASIRLQHGQLDAAIADLRQALNDQPRSAELMLLLASAYEHSGSIELAEKQFADATKASNFDAAVGLNFVSFLQRRGNIGRAEDLLTELASRWPNNIAILSTLAQVRLARQNWIGAQTVADDDSAHRQPWFRRSNFGCRICRTEQTRRECRCTSKRLRCRSRRRAANGHLGWRARECRQIGSSNAHFSKRCCNQIQITPKPMCCRAQFSWQKMRRNRPLRAFEPPSNVNRRIWSGYQALADFYVREKNNDEALKVIRAALDQQPDSFAMHLTLAGVLELKGDYEAAIAEYEHLLKQKSGSLIVANNLASLLSDHRTDKASLERAYSLATMLRKSPVPSFKDTLGWIHYLRGDYKNAAALLEEAAAALPESCLEFDTTSA